MDIALMLCFWLAFIYLFYRVNRGSKHKQITKITDKEETEKEHQ